MRTTFVAAAMVLCASFAFAQDAPPVTVSESLRTVWKNRQGTLVAVLPPQNAARRVAFPKDKASDAATVIALFAPSSEWKQHRFGDVSGIAPKMLGEYSAKLPPITALGATGDADGIQNVQTIFLAGLSAEQWRQIAAPGGLGYADLQTPEQRLLFEKIVPEPYGYQKSPADGEPVSRLLKPAERYTLRFRVTLTAVVHADTANGSKVSLYYNKNGSGEPQDRAYLLGSDTMNRLLAEAGRDPVPKKKYFTDYVEEDGSQWRHSQKVFSLAPNLPKPSEGNFAASNASISLLPQAGQPYLTVDELCKRAGEATGVTLIAHRKIGDYAVIVAGEAQAVPVRDLLPALCFSVGGAVRQLPPAPADTTPLFVLARDIEPLALLQDRFDQWYASSPFGTKNREYLTYSDKIAAADALPLLSFDDDDRFPLTPALRARYAEEARTDPNVTGRYGVSVALSDLSAEQAEYLQRMVRTANENTEGKPVPSPVRGARFRITADVRFNVYVPGEPFLGGRVSQGFVGNYGNWLPPVPVPASEPISLVGRVLYLRATTEDEAIQAAQIAVKNNVSALWLDAPPEVLAVAVVKARSLPVIAVVSPWQAQNAPDELSRDENPHQEKSADYLTPDDPKVVAWATERMRRVAQVKGIRGIVLQNAFPTGYRGSRVYDSGAGIWSGEPATLDYDRYRPLSDQFGYGVSRRRRYLVEHHLDPCDILLGVTSDIGEGNSKTQSPFRCSPELYNAWLDENRQRCADALKQVRDGAGNIPVYWAGVSVFLSRTARLAKMPSFVDRIQWYVAIMPGAPIPTDLYRGTWRDGIQAPEAKTGALVAIASAQTVSPVSELLERSKRGDAPHLTVVNWSHRTLVEVEAELSARKPTAKP